MRKVIAVVPIALVAGYLALSGSTRPDGGQQDIEAPIAPVPPVPTVAATAIPSTVADAVEQAHAAAATAHAQAAVAELRAGSAQVRVAADAHAAIAVSLDGLLEVLVQELERSAENGSSVDRTDLMVSVSALADLATSLDGMADIRVTDSTVTISSADGASVRVHRADTASRR